MYSIAPVLYAPNADGLCKISFQVIYKRSKFYLPTPYKVAQKQWNGKAVTGPLANKINQHLQNLKLELEGRIIDLLAAGGDTLRPDDIKQAITHKNSESITAFIDQLIIELKGKLSAGRLRHYKVLAGKIAAHAPALKLHQVTTDYLQKFDTWLIDEGLDQNTVNSKMNLFKAVLSKAAEKKLFDKKQIEYYHSPRYIQKIPDYLTDAELIAFEKVVEAVQKPGVKTSGYYFLLGCYTGYRISDLKAFSYEKNVKDGQVVLRAKKNKQIVSISIFPELKRVLAYVKDHPLTISEQHMRKYVREVAGLAGVKRHIKVHTARHTFAIWLLGKGFTIDEVAELLGDSKDVARIYARIVNTQLNKRVKELLG